MLKQAPWLLSSFNSLVWESITGSNSVLRYSKRNLFTFNSLVWESITGSTSKEAWRISVHYSFNSLVWESITGSVSGELSSYASGLFQFPCLGVYYWLGKGCQTCRCSIRALSIPLSGSLLLARSSGKEDPLPQPILSIPLSGSLLLAHPLAYLHAQRNLSPFNSLVWESITGSRYISIQLRYL